MKLSTRGRYGVRALLDLAIHCGEGPVLVRDVARRQGISKHYLEHLIIRLKAAGIVKSVRGAHGGVALAKLPSEIKLNDIIQILEGSMAPVECVTNPGVCPRSTFCVTRDVWAKVKGAIDEVFESMTLQDLAQRQQGKGESQAPMYYI